jgi:hypothetical protein
MNAVGRWFKKPRSKKRWTLYGIGATLVLLTLIGVLAPAPSDKTATTAATPTAATTQPEPVTTEPVVATTTPVDLCPNLSGDQSGVPAGYQLTGGKCVKPKPVKCWNGTKAPTKADCPARPIRYQALTARKWQLIAKNPDAFTGRHIIVYGEITQFDAATGTTAFRADAGGVKLKVEFGFVNYPTNTLFEGTENQLRNFVENDLFRAKVTVLGSYSYDTQIGGNTTVPDLSIDSIRRIGSVS